MPLSVQYHRMPQAALGCPRLPQAALGCPRLPQAAAPPRSNVETSTMQRGDCEVCVRSSRAEVSATFCPPARAMLSYAMHALPSSRSGSGRPARAFVTTAASASTAFASIQPGNLVVASTAFASTWPVLHVA